MLRKSKMAVDGCSARTRQLEFYVSRYFDVQQLSAQVRQKWEQASSGTRINHSASLEEILKRQQAAEEKRLVRFASRKPFSFRDVVVVWARFQEAHILISF